ncbi:protein kinase domain-containing protein [Kitasatospora purpeofusca]|uniref:protein kinase domain-containing protein n=1 Tax=Kitasatospora purpeofusca TaxID=67352 RepID=UPI002A5AF2FC|nr:protein kinase [Kitasatospora purpeofusca]MDY0814584.1 protein kinase [Kitasatospora purpeofusca]
MAQTQHPDDDGARAAGPGGGAPRTPEPGGDAATTALPPYGAPHTPGRGTAAPLGTVGDGRYRLTHRLGRGGMAEVLAAQDVRLGRTVAVKLLRGELAQDEIARLRFTREAHAVAALNHHAIVAVYDTGEEYVGEESTPYIVMELVEGRTVRELLVDEEEPPVDQALIIIAGVLEALAYSHRHGIVHRDIKPANVIITTTGAVKVMDFGIARALTGTASTMTQTGMVMGTPQYLSPEQALGKPVDHRSDLYAAGCMLYELLALRPPFTGDTPLSVVYQHVQDMPVPPSQANPRVPAGLDHLVLRSLAKNPDDRFQDADEFRAHIEHALRELTGGTGGWPLGATAGLAAAGQGHGGMPPLGVDETAVLGAGVPGDPTAMLPYQVPGGPHTPSSAYPPYGGDGSDDGHSGGHGRGGGGGRGPWRWVAGIVAVAVAASVGIAMALSGNDTGGGGGGKPSDLGPGTGVVSTAPEATTPSSGSTTTTPPAGQTSRRPQQQPTDTNSNGGNQTQPPSQPTGKHTTSPAATPSPTGSKAPSPTASPTGSATAPPTTTPTTGTATGATTPPATTPPATNPPPTGGAGSQTPTAGGAAGGTVPKPPGGPAIPPAP